jgi:hypothetical protein
MNRTSGALGFSRRAADIWARERGLPAIPAYLGQVATRSYIPNNISTGLRSGNGQTFHVAREDITSIQVAYANWFHSSAVHEAGSGGTLTVTASIQYPIADNPGSGEWQAFTWSGDEGTGIIPDGATSPLSDALPLAVPIPRGAAFLLRWHAEASAQIPFWQFGSSNSAALNQIAEASTTPAAFSDKTPGGTINAGTSANNLYPVLIVGETTRPSCYIFGDSRVHGIGDSFDATGHTGEVARSLGERYAYLNLGCPSETLSGWLAGSTRRRALLPFFSHVIGNMSINDVAQGRTSPQLAADIAAAAALVGADGRKVLWATMCPSSTGPWNATSSQGVSTSNAQRTAVNDKLRARQIAGIDGVLDIASAIETDLNSGLWAVDHDGSGGVAMTSDGLHANYAGYQRIKRSGAVSPDIVAIV